MRLRGEIIGALNLFRTETGSLNDDDVIVAQALADIATIAILQNRNTVAKQDLNTQLETALSSRIVIEQAKGMIAERRNIAADEAFSHLRSLRPQPQPAPRRRRPQHRSRAPSTPRPSHRPDPDAAASTAAVILRRPGSSGDGQPVERCSAASTT